MSNINPQSIDGTYPIAGQDNNSQGFRDNFTNTVNNFTFAAAELTDLQNNAVLKAALGSVGQTGTPTNDLNYAYLTHAQLKGTVETTNDIGNVISGGFNVDWATGHFQIVDLVGTSASLTFPSTWPATNLYTKLRLQVNTYANVCALTLPSAVSTNISSIQGASGQVVTLPAGSVYQFEFSTWDNGATVAIQDVLRNYDITANGASTTFTTVTAGRVNAAFVGNVGTVITGAAISANTLNISGNIIGGLTQLSALNNTPIGNATASTGAFTSLSATGAVIQSGYQFYQPSANVFIQANVDISRVIIAPISSALVSFSANVTLPNTTVDGTVVSISSNSAVQFFSVMAPYPNSGRQITPQGNVALSAGAKAEYLYRSANNTWYRVG
jgi:hypothetical protein